MRNILALIIAAFAISQANAVAFDAHSSFVDEQINAAIQAAINGGHYTITRPATNARVDGAAAPSVTPMAPTASRLIDASTSPVGPQPTTRPGDTFVSTSKERLYFLSLESLKTTASHSRRIETFS